MQKIILLFLFCSSVVFAQETYKKSLSGIKKVRIESGTKITIVAGSSSEMILSEETQKKDSGRYWRENRKDKTNDRKKGLRPIYPGGEDNTDGFGFSVTTENGVMIVKDLKSHFQRSDIKITLPKSMHIDVDSGNLGSITVEGFTSEVEATTNVGEINLKDVTGPITAHSSTGTVTVVFSKVNQSAPITISSATGEIDVALPSNTPADLTVKTNGTLYTNFDLKAPPKKGLPKRGGASNIEKALNGGGVNIKLQSAMGNIYLRKKE
jgi:hypothetical protein